MSWTPNSCLCKSNVGSEPQSCPPPPFLILESTLLPSRLSPKPCCLNANSHQQQSEDSLIAFPFPVFSSYYKFLSFSLPLNALPVISWYSLCLSFSGSICIAVSFSSWAELPNLHVYSLLTLLGISIRLESKNCHRTQASSTGESPMYIAANYIQVASWNQNARIKSKQTKKQTTKLTAAPPPASLFLHAGFVFPRRKIGKWQFPSYRVTTPA